MTTDNDPRGFGAVDFGEIGGEPVGLLVHEAEGTCVFSSSCWLIGADETVAYLLVRTLSQVAFVVEGYINIPRSVSVSIWT